MQYVVKVHMKRTGTYSVGPYHTVEEAEDVAKDIAFYGANTLCTQRGTKIFLCDEPEVVEVVSFVRKD
jgi:pyruvate/oxaloacetate carboxyltransferase